MKRIRGIIIGLVVVSLLACSLTRQAASNVPSATATPLPPTWTPAPEEGWQAVAQGIETRLVAVEPPFTTTAFAMRVVRIDPTQATFRAHYVPRQWFTIEEWAGQLDQALVVINANFFTSGGEAVGLVVAEGQAYGASFDGFGGMFEVGFTQTARVRSLVAEPYREEQFLQVVQGFPMLIERGGQPARTGEGFDDPARRTIIAQDEYGRILLMVAPILGQLTLRNAQKWLFNSPLGIEIAFGLDGGKSSGMYLATPDEPTLLPSVEPVPVVLAVYPR